MFTLTTKLKGTFGSEETVGDGGEEDLSSFALIACCNCSYFGPLRYLSNVNVTAVPVFLKTFTASWFVQPITDLPST